MNHSSVVDQPAMYRYAFGPAVSPLSLYTGLTDANTGTHFSWGYPSDCHAVSLTYGSVTVFRFVVKSVWFSITWHQVTTNAVNRCSENCQTVWWWSRVTTIGTALYVEPSFTCSKQRRNSGGRRQFTPQLTSRLDIRQRGPRQPRPNFIWLRSHVPHVAQQLLVTATNQKCFIIPIIAVANRGLFSRASWCTFNPTPLGQARTTRIASGRSYNCFFCHNHTVYTDPYRIRFIGWLPRPSRT